MRSDWVLIALIFVIGIFAAGQFIKVSLSLPQLSAFYGYGIAEVSVLVSLVGIVSIVFGLVAGNIVAAFGARKTLLRCVATWVINVNPASIFTAYMGDVDFALR